MNGLMIKDVAKQLNVEAYVLRYWEEELHLDITRNDMGHRCYQPDEVMLLGRIKELRDKGIGLREIKEAIVARKSTVGLELSEAKKIVEKAKENIYDTKYVENLSKNHATSNEEPVHNTLDKPEDINMSEDIEHKLMQSLSDDSKVVSFELVQLQAMMNKVVANAFVENKNIISNAIKGELVEDVMKQMDVILKERDDREEEHFRRLDENMRQLQRVSSEVAATKSRRGFFKRK